MIIQTSGQEFHKYVSKADSSLHKENITTYLPREYEEMNCLIHPSGTAGAAVRADGELVSVFNLGTVVKGITSELIPAAIAVGAKKLDCFDGFLTDLYNIFGFQEYKRELNWVPGEPDVVFMKL